MLSVQTSAPMRVSFAGGGSDYRAFANQHGGDVVSVALAWRVHVVIHPLSDLAEELYRCSYSRVESRRGVEEIQHPTIRGALEALNWRTPIGIYTWSDIPARTGLGGSSAFVVALLAALHQYRRTRVDQWALARQAVEIERNRAGEPGGEQDQYAAAFGGFRRYSFSNACGVELRSMPRRYLGALRDGLLLVSSGETAIRRSSATVGEQMASSGDPDGDRMFQRNTARRLVEEIDRAKWARRLSLEPIGEAMRLSQRRKVLLWPASTDVGTMLNHVQGSGSIGEKLCGAGGGGLVAAIVPRERQAEFNIRMANAGYRVYRPGVSRDGVRASKKLRTLE